MNYFGKSLEHPSSGSEMSAELEVITAGSENMTAAGLNDDLGRLLGAVGDYAADVVLCLKEIGRREHQAYIKPTTDGRWVCLFDWHGAVGLTVACATEALAAASALHFLASKQ